MIILCCIIAFISTIFYYILRCFHMVPGIWLRSRRWVYYYLFVWLHVYHQHLLEFVHIIIGIQSYDRPDTSELTLKNMGNIDRKLTTTNATTLGLITKSSWWARWCFKSPASRLFTQLCVTGLCEGTSPVTGDSPHKGPVTREMVPFDDGIMWVRISWRILYPRDPLAP